MNRLNHFEARGEAQLLALEGQRMIALALGRLIKKGFSNLVSMLTRQAPSLRKS